MLGNKLQQWSATTFLLARVTAVWTMEVQDGSGVWACWQWCGATDGVESGGGHVLVFARCSSHHAEDACLTYALFLLVGTAKTCV